MFFFIKGIIRIGIWGQESGDIKGSVDKDYYVIWIVFFMILYK